MCSLRLQLKGLHFCMYGSTSLKMTAIEVKSLAGLVSVDVALAKNKRGCYVSCKMLSSIVTAFD